ncbi:MAG: DUF2927 domain-containing protein [Pseudomonadota bacterium]
MLSFRRLGAVVLAALVAAGCATPTEFYRDREQTLLDKGFMRAERDPADVSFDNDDLRRNFIEVALYREFAPGGVQPERTASKIWRWSGPVRYRLAGTSAGVEDRNVVADLMRRISGLSGLDIAAADRNRTDEDDGNFFIFIIDDSEREEFLEKYAERRGEDRAAFKREWQKSIGRPCVATIYSDGEGNIGAAIVLIKSELTGLTRRSCIHEEIVQSFGLANDANWIRPSLFNDTNEFAHMTLHDEYLMQILYDDRLSPGMEVEDVEPLLDQIIADIRPEAES